MVVTGGASDSFEAAGCSGAGLEVGSGFVRAVCGGCADALTPAGLVATAPFRLRKNVAYSELLLTTAEDGAAVDQPFEFQPGVGLIQGWTDGVLQMNIGERAYLHVPSKLGYGSNPMGSPGGAFYIPANSNLLFDIEILGIVGETEL